MKKNSLNTLDGRGRPRTRLGAKVLSITTAFALAMSMCPVAYANDGFADLESQTLAAEGEGGHHGHRGYPQYEYRRIQGDRKRDDQS